LADETSRSGATVVIVRSDSETLQIKSTVPPHTKKEKKQKISGAHRPKDGLGAVY